MHQAHGGGYFRSRLRYATLIPALAGMRRQLLAALAAAALEDATSGFRAHASTESVIAQPATSFADQCTLGHTFPPTNK